MEHAWLDSLSEDWVSQPRSDSPKSPPAKQENQKPPNINGLGSRIPRPVSGLTSSLPGTNDNSINVLGERSISDINIPVAKRGPSKLSREVSRGEGPAGRTVSTATNGSVVHNTVQHKSNASPKRKGDTPEWKKRLVYGDIVYGEQRDLFCSAAAGLEGMFKPPPPPVRKDEEDPFFEEDSGRNETTLPSSPPLFRPPPRVPMPDGYSNDESEIDGHFEASPSPSPRKGPREVQYRTMEDYGEGSSLGAGDFQIHQDSTSLEEKQVASQRLEISNDGLAPASDDESRKVSGQSVFRNEDFSPIIISKHSDEDGRVGFAPMEVPADKLRQKLENLRVNQILFDSHADQSLHGNSPQPENRSIIDNTEDYVRLGGFVNLRRGGRSAEGSFRHRLLSPALGVDTSEMLPEESLQASTPKQFPTIRTDLRSQADRSPSIPRAPYPSPEKKQAYPQPGAGSPLKLFGPYDTFTNQTLMRRISQFEEPMSGSPSRQSLGQSRGEESSQLHGDENAEPQSKKEPEEARPRSVSHFGVGDLEGFEFSGDLSMEASLKDIEHPSFEDASDISWKQNSLSGREDQLLVRRRRHTSKHSRVLSPIIPYVPGAANFNHIDILATPKRDSGSDGKRPRTSPSKDPTPKRRRTLHKSDIAYGREDLVVLDMIQSTTEQMQAAMGKKRKDARPGDIQQVARPEVMAHRQILRPRTPTPSQRSSIQREQHPDFDFDFDVDVDADPPPTGGRLKRSPIRGTHSTFGTHSSGIDGDRKPSIKTQDFLDEAAQIMAMIRNQVRPPNGLESVEESDAENAQPSPDMADESLQESTKEPFSRPPSRDGAPVSHMASRQQDPEIVRRLRQYQELSDMGDIISSSMRSMGLAKEAIRTAQEVQEDVERRLRQSAGRPHVPDLADGEVYSDPPNIRLSQKPSAENLHNPASGAGTTSFPSHSSGSSTNRSIPTGSSRGSESRKTIMPQSVSHLIPDQVGSMYLDRNKNIWVRKKTSARKLNVLPSEASDDDPFANIPDLSVDMTLEMRNLHQTAKAQEGESTSPGSSPFKTPSHTKGYVTLSPDAAVDPGMVSRARDELTKLESKINHMASEKDDVEHEIGINEGRGTQRTPSKRRNLTISFSSPIASIIQDVVPEDLDSLSDDGNAIDPRQINSPTRDGTTPSSQPSSQRAMPLTGRKTPRGSLRQPSFARVAFVPRPVSRIEERDEEGAGNDRQVSIIGNNSVVEHTPQARHTSVSFVVTAVPAVDVEAVDASAVIGQNIGNLSLSPLSEFTAHHGDQSFGLEVSYIVNERRLVSGDGSKKVMSMTIRDLVDRLTEVEPSEPFWSDLESLDLHEKRLSSLHMLDEFCGQLVSLDACNNQLEHLDGVPPTVRQLKVNFNMLSELTSWDHLMNLQYVDVSNNDISSLSGLKGLVHLRSLRADNNCLTSLGGLEHHDGLLSLRARNNQIEEVDFEGTKLIHLGELDLGGNRIDTVRNIERLPSLSILKLQRNKLQSFTASGRVQNLKHLDLSGNDLTTLDLSRYPKLRILHADRNCLSSVTGFTVARQLDSLSLREQKGNEPLDLSFLSSAYEVRKLFLSGNYVGTTFDPKVDFLNLQLLELANCGLEFLPENMGQLMPNLRTLNLNYNAISDLSPLRFVPRMKKLLVAGNRLADSTAVTQLLTDFHHLTRLDLRDNPFSLGFYPSLQVLVPADGSSSADPFTLPEGEVERDESFRGRLDSGTKLRRRLHWLVFVGCCARLRFLDGLPAKRVEVLRRDAVLDILVKEGLLPPGLVNMCVDGEGDGEKVGEEGNRWNAKDSFA